MQISTKHSYAADPASTYAMMTDPEFMNRLVKAVGAEDAEVSSANGRTRIRAATPAPEQVVRFIGKTLNLDLSITWGEAAADGSRRGPISATIDGAPAKLTGEASMRPGHVGTEVEYTGDFTINIPFLGKQMEKAAAPYVLKVLDLQQDLGNTWLAERK